MKIDSITIYGYSVILAVAFLWGAFIAYKKAIEAHLEEIHILDAVVLAGFWSFVLARLIYVLLNFRLFWNNLPRILFLRNYPGLDHWGLLLGIVVALLIITRTHKQKFVDWLDYSMIGMVGGMSIYFAAMAIGAFSWVSVGGALMSLGMFIFLWRAEKVYRTYDWYKNRKTQSRTGFLSGVGLSFYGFTHLMLLLLSGNVGVLALVINASLFVGGFVMVYSRSGRNFTEDLKFIAKHGKK